MELSKRFIGRFQEGGPMPAEAGAAPEGAPMGPEAGAPAGPGPDEMMQQAAQIAQQLIQEAGPELAGAIFQIGMEMLQGGAPGGEAPMPAPEEQPAFQRMGGRLVRIR